MDTIKKFNQVISLLTYEQIIAMTINDAVAELNKYPDLYYNMLTEHTPVEGGGDAEEWHLFDIPQNKSGVIHKVIGSFAENRIPYPYAIYSYNTNSLRPRAALISGGQDILSVIKWTGTGFTSIDLYASDYYVVV